MKSVLETLEAGTAYLERRGVESARLNMQLLAAHVLGCSRLDLYLEFDRPLGELELGELRELLRRRGRREPLQHVLGKVEFCGREFRCDGRALVPRPETEELAAYLLAQGHWVPDGGAAVDVGTGSGVIGLTLALAWRGRGVRVICSDVSAEALALARENRDQLALDEAEASLVQGDLLEKVAGPADLIVANLPYVASGEIEELEAEVRHDPRMALDGGGDGTELILRLLPGAAGCLRQGGRLALEVGAGQAPAIAEAMRAQGWREVELRRDLGGIERFVLGVAERGMA